jgi:acetate kinase
MKSLQFLTLNAGSSSIKFSAYEVGDPLHENELLRKSQPLHKTLSGKIVRIGLPESVLTYSDNDTASPASCAVEAGNLTQAADFLAGWLEKHIDIKHLGAIGHRVVQGLDHAHATLIDEPLLQELRGTLANDPDHLPAELALIDLFRERHPGIPQVACFDTAFYAHLPRMAKILAIPRHFEKTGIRRYGFHGLSYTSLLEQLMGVADPIAVMGRCILAHLGNGASITATRDQQPIDTSMGFTPAGGLPMSTRSGDLDPGVISYLLQQRGLSLSEFDNLINHQSGLIGISETSSDMEDLLKKESTDERAAEAVAFFCYQVKKWIGSYTAILGGVDVLAFTGGIGEKAARIRSRICMGLGYLGIELDEERNQRNKLLISADSSRVPVYCIPADEESIIARQTANAIIQH